MKVESRCIGGRRSDPPAAKTATHLLDLKLRDLPSNSRTNQQPLTRIVNLHLDTPSTVADMKKFHSCDLNKRPNPLPSKPTPSMQLDPPTTILTLHEIKQQEHRSKQRQQRQSSLKKQPSRKLFVSISRKNLPQRCVSPVLRGEECVLEEGGGQGRQVLKLGVYREMARRRG